MGQWDYRCFLNSPGCICVGNFSQGLSLGGTLSRARDLRVFEVVDEHVIFVDGRHFDVRYKYCVRRGRRKKLVFEKIY